MARHARPCSAASHWIPAWIFHSEPTGKSEIAQFKEVIKTVHNQYLSLDGHRWEGRGPAPRPPTPKALFFSLTAALLHQIKQKREQAAPAPS